MVSERNGDMSLKQEDFQVIGDCVAVAGCCGKRIRTEICFFSRVNKKRKQVMLTQPPVLGSGFTACPKYPIVTVKILVT